MKKRDWVALGTVLFTFGVGLTGCADSDRKSSRAQSEQTDGNSTVAAVDSNLPNEKQELVTTIKQTVATLEKQLEDVDSKLHVSAEKEQLKWKNRKEQLHIQKKELHSVLDSVHDQTSEQWHEFKVRAKKRVEKIETDLGDSNH